MSRENGQENGQQPALEQSIGSELLDTTPEHWKRIRLEVDYRQEGGVESYGHEISSPEGHGEPVAPSERLMELTRELGERFAREGRRFSRLVAELAEKDDGNWRFRFDYSYPENEAG
jgi:hypothetical protein